MTASIKAKLQNYSVWKTNINTFRVSEFNKQNIDLILNKIVYKCDKKNYLHAGYCLSTYLHF